MVLAEETSSEELRCHGCGYDLRAHPLEGMCSECGASVAEARRLAMEVPVRPVWSKSDPRWRRRMVAGLWVLTFVPLMDVLNEFRWASKIPVPVVFNYKATVLSLADTMVTWGGIYRPLVMCIGLVLLFSRERGRRKGWFDWVPQWGVVFCYLLLLLAAVEAMFLVALVTAGIAALCMSIRLNHQPELTPFLVSSSYWYLRHGPHPTLLAEMVLTAVSSLAVILAWVPMRDALRATLAKNHWGLAWMLPGLLGIYALMALGKIGGYLMGFPGVMKSDVLSQMYYFESYLPVRSLAWLWQGRRLASVLTLSNLIEVTKWGVFAGMAVWLTVAQIRVRWITRQAAI